MVNIVRSILPRRQNKGPDGSINSELCVTFLTRSNFLMCVHCAVMDSHRSVAMYTEFLRRGAEIKKAKEIITLFIRTGGKGIPLPILNGAVHSLYKQIRKGTKDRQTNVTRRITKYAEKIDDTSLCLNDLLSDVIGDVDNILGSLEINENVVIPSIYEDDSDEEEGVEEVSEEGGGATTKAGKKTQEMIDLEQMLKEIAISAQGPIADTSIPSTVSPSTKRDQKRHKQDLKRQQQQLDMMPQVRQGGLSRSNSDDEDAPGWGGQLGGGRDSRLHSREAGVSQANSG